ncbi:MAG: aminopeptidase P family protein [Actinobacteria bacterium]|nr:aminopeptidase P family protein [Actinomycetota bacterium]
MRRDRHARLVASMADDGIDALLLLGQGNVVYATGVRVPACDQNLANHRRAVALVTADGAPPHLWTWYPEGAPPDLPTDHVHGGLRLEIPDDAAALAALVHEACPAGVLAVDELTMPLRAAFGTRPLADASVTLGRAKIQKTADELECIRRAQRINEAAIADVKAILRPGVRGTDLTGHLLERIFALGASGNTVDPIWQVMPPSIAAGPFTMTGDVVFPLRTTDRPFAAGDVIWVDNGIQYEGYQSDFGHTWIVGEAPDATRRDQCARYRAVIDAVVDAIRPGVTALELTRVAKAVEAGRRTPWLAHFYLAHGTGTESAEAPLIGTDLGDAFDETVVLTPGTVLVLEPVIWDDGHGGFRAEDIVVVTDTGAERISRRDDSDYE